MASEIIQTMQQLLEELAMNEKINFEHADMIYEPASRQLLSQAKSIEGMNEELLNIYTSFNGLNLRWTHADFAVDDVRGDANILSLEALLQQREGIIYFKDTPAEDELRKFYLLDFFADEAACGFYSIKQKNNRIYFHRFEGTPFDLHLDVEGYFKMLKTAKGFRYWPYAIMAIIEKTDSEINQRFKKYMPLLFTDFNYDSFVQLYEQVKIK